MSNRLPFYDGSLVNAQRHGPCIVSADPVTRSRMFTYTYHQLEPYYIQQMGLQERVSGNVVFDNRDPSSGGFLIEWGEPKHINGGVLEFTRTYAQVPRTRVEFELFNYNWQYVTSEGGLAEIPLLLRSRIVYQYVHTTTPEGIQVSKAPRYYLIGTTINVMGNERDLLKPEYLGEDETVFRWKPGGNIWGKKSRLIPRPTSLAVVT